MSRGKFLTLGCPKGRRSGLDLRIRFFFYGEWLRGAPSSEGPSFISSRIFLAPHLPFSIIPRRMVDQLGIRLTSVVGEAAVSQQAAQFGLAAAEPRIACLRFLDHLTTPHRSDRRRTFYLLALLPPPGPTGPWTEPHLGADFLMEHQMRLFLDYGRLRYRSDPAIPGQIQIDPNEPCGHLEYPGEYGPSSGLPETELV